MPDPDKRWRRLSADRVAALLFLALVGIYGWQGTQFTAALQVDVVGPSFFPKVLTAAGVLLGLFLIGSATGRQSESERDKPRRDDRAALTPAALLLGYIIAFEPAGFPLATFVFLIMGFKYLGYPSWSGAAAWGLTVTALAWLVFYVGLDLRLPLGPLGLFR
jgi:putative tricarboxylic transport membrane protein